MMDVADKRGISTDIEKLSSLLGVPVVPIVTRNGKNGVKNTIYGDGFENLRLLSNILCVVLT
ncbi:hypothetical protein MTBBW1_1870001 [Desulfamplus magnetovallimortis]|uniref:FeoB-type G domain-containing protein n=1 Tax=Desulfamplus magnetovallimortis TaxID=1246637 RepID=A0A1W1HB04_9BACT|nr:FeoB small GTPase domain-containing protein [Desulfamplus magnetovallimortis]SLM29558.1 hypothetical protein MTBBW1_1870001 [Desulfamplus magnetovallimortis]